MQLQYGRLLKLFGDFISLIGIVELFEYTVNTQKIL